MSHQHHHCECKHQRLAFCPKCQVPHCLDCGKEWAEKCTWSHYPTYYGTTDYPTYPTITPIWSTTSGTVTTTGVSGVSTSSATQYDPNALITYTSCSHGREEASQ